jgi:L-ascorbate metabolism protein UlaG (beta-lactamase superfamily)
MIKLIKAYQKDEALLQDIEQCRQDQNRFHIWWLGQSGFLLQWNGKHVLFDPYLSDALTLKYAKTDKPHIRMSELVIRPEKLNFIDIVTSSHNHTDHLDAATLIPLLKVNPSIQMVIPEANRTFVSDRIRQPPEFPVGLNSDEDVSIQGFSFYGIPAAHNALDRDTMGHCRYMGYVVRFGPYTIYHSGDTLWHDAIINSLKHFKIDLAMLPINGNKPERRVAGNLDAKEAVQLAQLLDIKMVIPCHYHMFTFNTVDPDEFILEAKKKNVSYKILQGGERWTSNGKP